MNDTSLMIKNQTPTYVSVGPNSNQTLSSTVIPPPPPPLPPLVPPHLKIPPKPKISGMFVLIFMNSYHDIIILTIFFS